MCELSLVDHIYLARGPILKHFNEKDGLLENKKDDVLSACELSALAMPIMSQSILSLTDSWSLMNEVADHTNLKPPSIVLC